MRTTAANSASLRVLLSLALGLSAALGYATAAPAQSLPPSLYVGVGTGSNVGGTVGVGVEVPVHEVLTVSTAIGVWPASLTTAEFAHRSLDFDVGLKAYPFGAFFFGGINYGIVHAEIFTADELGRREMRKRHAFTFSIGGRTRLIGRSYGSLFAGVTSDPEANTMRHFDRRVFVPHFGLLIGLMLSRPH